MSQNFAIVKKDLQQYYKETGKRFVTPSRILKLLLKSLIHSKVLIVLGLVTLAVFFRPIDAMPKSFYIYIAQFAAFIIFIVILILYLVKFNNFLLEAYQHEVLHEYGQIKRSKVLLANYTAFLNLMRIVLSFCFAIFAVLIIFGQFSFVSAYLKPTLESCSMYDMYGNLLYENNNPKTCLALTDYTESPSQIAFSVTNDHTETDYTYNYTTGLTDNLKNRLISVYEIQNGNKTLVSSENLTIDYKTQSAAYTRMVTENNATSQDTFIATESGNTIAVTKNNHSLYNITLQTNNDTTDYSYSNTFTQSANVNSIIDTYGTPDQFTRQVTYQNTSLINILNTANDPSYPQFMLLYTISSVKNDTGSYRFTISDFMNWTMFPYDYYISEYDHNSLIYRYLLKYTKFAIKVETYSYKRTSTLSMSKGEGDCPVRTDMLAEHYDFENFMNVPDQNSCYVPLFYPANPLLIGSESLLSGKTVS